MNDYTVELAELKSNALKHFGLVGNLPPAIVYHYTSPDGFMGIIKDSCKLYFTQYDSLNDKSERFDVIDSLIDYCCYKVKQGVISEDLLNVIKEIKPSNLVTITKEVKQTIELSSGELFPSLVETEHKDCYTYLCCFSKNSDSLAMWNYYSKSKRYEGYSLGIARSHLDIPFYKGNQYTLELKEVIYTSKDKYELFDNYLLPLFLQYDKSTEQTKISIINVIVRCMEKVQFIFKNEHFLHEDEVRAILKVSKNFKSDDKVSERKFRTSNGYIVPYVELTLSKNDLRRIVTAPLFEKDLAVKNLESMLKQKGFNNTKVVPSSIPIRF